MESTKLVNGCTFHWCSKCTPPQWSTTHSMAMHTDFPSSSTHNTNAQLLDFNAAAWVINIPVHDKKLAFSNNLPQATPPTLCAAFQTSTMFTKLYLSPTMTPCLMPLNQPLSSALQMPPSMGATHLHPPP